MTLLEIPNLSPNPIHTKCTSLVSEIPMLFECALKSEPDIWGKFSEEVIKNELPSWQYG